jgi:TrmH family RNA methyltransferase
MTRMNPLTSRRHPFVLRCRELAGGRSAADAEVLLDGPHLIEDALAAGVEILAVAVGPRLLDEPATQGLLAALGAGAAEVFAATESVLEAASPVRSPSGIVALARFALAGPERVFAADSGVVLGGIGLQDPGNVGAIIRTADAAGATGMVVTQGSADPLGWKALRGSTGSAFRLPLAAGLTALETCAMARAHGLQVIATCPADGQDVHDVDLTQPLLLLLGGEGPGLTDELLAQADARLRIPLRAPVESLNVAVAAGIILFEVRRQRQLAYRRGGNRASSQ